MAELTNADDDWVKVPRQEIEAEIAAGWKPLIDAASGDQRRRLESARDSEIIGARSGAEMSEEFRHIGWKGARIDPPPKAFPPEDDGWEPVLATERPAPTAGEALPEAFVGRLRAGQALARIVSEAAKGAQEGAGSGTPTGFEDDTLNHLIDMGIFHDPAKGRGGPIQMVNEAVLMPSAQIWQAITRATSGAIHGAGGAMGQIVEEFGGSQGTANRAKNEIINLGNWAMIEGGMGRFSRPSVEGGNVFDRPVGFLPAEADFAAAGKVLESPHAEANLRRMWSEDGIHPAEAVHDAQTDAFVKHEITAPREIVKIEPEIEAILEETGGKPGSLSAAVTEPGDIPLDVQPAQPPGRLAAMFQGAADNLLDIGRDAQMLVAPMARGTRDSIALVKDFANALRRNRWDWSRIDDDIKVRFDAESRARMWNAADEESVSLQLGEPEHMRAHQGLSTLDPAERALVDELQARALNAWERAKDIGMVKGEALPSYTPRMVLNIGTAFADDKALPLNSMGQNLRVRTAQMLRRKHLTVEETERAARDYVGMREALKGKSKEEIEAAIDQVAVARDIRALPLATSKLEDAVAGRTLIENIKKYGAQSGTDTVVEGAIPAGSETKWFTLDHPAFRTWRPQLREIEGKVEAVKDAEGNPVFEQVPIYIHGDFEGPLRAVLSYKGNKLYEGLVALKAKTMSVIMNSPMIHNAVEWGRALPAMPGKVATFKIYVEGNRAKNNVELMHEAIDAGLVPIGHRFFNQDITSIMEAPDLTPGRSWTAKLLGAVPDLFDPAAGNAVKAAVDKAGDFWHNTLLWDRIADLQMGLYVNLRNDAIAKGIDQQTASRMAAHWANRYAGALPKEAMSDLATKWANVLMFSRSFTVGNWGVFKDMLTGLPKDVLAQIERDVGTIDPKAVDYAKSLARRKAMTIVVADMAMMYVGNSILQSALNVMFNDSTLEKEYHGYTERLLAKLEAVKEHPLELIQPLRLLEDLSATNENEPGKRDRVRVGNLKDGTAIYARNPVGKIGEEFVGFMTGPLDMMRKKLSTIARPTWQIASNDAGFGRKVYDPNAETPAKYLRNLALIARHLVVAQFPEGQFNAFADLVRGEGDAKVNAMQAFGPVAGVTFSKGAPGGPAVGEMYAAKSRHEFEVNQALPDIRRQILRGDLDGAISRMTELDIDQGLQRWYLKTTLNPSLRMSPRAVRDFYLHSTPEQRARFDRARQAVQ